MLSSEHGTMTKDVTHFAFDVRNSEVKLVQIWESVLAVPPSMGPLYL